MAIVGGLISAAGSIAGGMAQAAQARYQAQVAKNNAIIADRNADYARIKGSREEEAFRIKAGNIGATQKAAFSTSGIDVNVGSPFRVLRGTKILTQLDALTIRNNAAREAHDFETQKVNFEAQSGLYKMQANQAMLSGLIGGASGIVGAVGNVASKWDAFRSPVPYSPVSYGPGFAPSTATMTVPTVSEPGAGLSAPAYVSYRPGPGAGPAYRN